MLTREWGLRGSSSPWGGEGPPHQNLSVPGESPPAAASLLKELGERRALRVALTSVPEEGSRAVCAVWVTVNKLAFLVLAFPSRPRICQQQHKAANMFFSFQSFSPTLLSACGFRFRE